jgi:hypothetical protein
MSLFHVIVVRALFPRVLAVLQGHERVRVKLSEARTFLPDLPVFHVLTVSVLFPCVSTVSQGSERVRVNLGDAQLFLPDMPVFHIFAFLDVVSMRSGRVPM